MMSSGSLGTGMRTVNMCSMAGCKVSIEKRRGCLKLGIVFPSGSH